MRLHIRLGLAVVMLCAGTVSPAAPKGDEALIQLLQTKQCRQCQLADVNLVHAQLQDADLEGAKLQRANLSQARLDGANLRGADLSFTSLHGASLLGELQQAAQSRGEAPIDATQNQIRLVDHINPGLKLQTRHPKGHRH